MTQVPSGDDVDVAALIVESEPDLLAFVRKNAGARLLRFDEVEDLVQGILTEALRAVERYEYRSRPEFFGWLYTIARRYLADRGAHWKALKRRSSRVIRLVQAETGMSTRLDIDPADTGTSPSRFAARREEVVMVLKAMATLLPRDRDLIQWSGQGVPITEQAERLGISYQAAERARLRAMERLKKAHALLVQSYSRPS